MQKLLFSRGEIFWTEDAEGDDQLHPGPEGQRALGICHCRRQGPGEISIPPPFKLKSIEGSAFALSGPDSEAGQDQSVLQR